MPAELIGDACARGKVMATGLVLGGRRRLRGGVSQTLGATAPACRACWLPRAIEDYIEDMLIALRA